ncbi:hypothetical protein ALC56_11166 [Trachymyrmex septentrionalis]|uniref:Uncharacterized protein n=1 Tax=Trachymyrmex septentrionalis TaxID=34720 RepID=A0A195F3C2_9HYME|nr:hypothetical protein ALC56_11166 [Trachymyrmex septentrionalis]
MEMTGAPPRLSVHWAAHTSGAANFCHFNPGGASSSCLRSRFQRETITAFVMRAALLTLLLQGARRYHMAVRLRNRILGALDKISSPFPRERTVSSSPCPSQHDSFILVSVLFLDTGVLNLTLHLRRPPSVYFHSFHTVDGTRRRRKRNSEGELSRRRVSARLDRSGGGRIWLAMDSILSRE